MLWVESRRAVIAGDTLVDFGQGLEIPPEWLPDGVTPEQVTEGLRPLLERPVEHVLATHGGPPDRAALERALSLSARGLSLLRSRRLDPLALSQDDTFAWGQRPRMSLNDLEMLRG